MKVAVAIICDEHQRILVTQRPLHVPHGGLWEFPGGKLEPEELAEHALIREIKEEVGLDVTKYKFLGDVTYKYPDKLVHLIVFHVTDFTGIPSCKEGQLAMQWIEKNNLNAKDFPEANHAIFSLLSSIASVLVK